MAMPLITRGWNKKGDRHENIGHISDRGRNARHDRGAGVTSAAAQGVYVEGPGFGVGIGRPAYRERHYRGDYAYAGPRFYSERRYHRGPHVYERHSYRWRDRDWD